MRSSVPRNKSLATAIRQASKSPIGGTPTVRVKRSKKVERDSPDTLPSCRDRTMAAQLSVHLPYRWRELRIR